MVNVAQNLGERIVYYVNYAGSLTKLFFRTLYWMFIPPFKRERLFVQARTIGVDSLLIVTPPYTKPHIDGLIAHFSIIAKAVQIPLCLYHVPGRTGYKLLPEDIQKICAVDGVEGVKEASGDLRLFAVARRLARVPFLSGDDTTFLPSLSIDGHGCISVISNVYPSEMVNMQNLFQAGNWYEAYSIYDKILALMELLASNNPSPLKAALSIKGLCKNILRLPMTPVGERVYNAIAGELS